MKTKLFFLPAIILCLMFVSNAYGQIESEPNNSFNDANILTITNLTSNIQGSINPIGDLDFYRIDLPQAGVLDIDVSNITNGVEMEITLYDATQNQIADVVGISSPTRSMSQLVCGAGTYYIKLNDEFNNDASNDLYNLIVSLDVEDVYECNNDFTTAAMIPLDQTINAKNKNIGDLDFYRIDLPQAGVLDIDVSNITNGIEMEITLYDAAQNQLAIIGSSVSNPTRSMSQLVCSAGTYFIKLNDRSNNEASNDLYSLIVSLDVEDVYECNNDFTTAAMIPLDQTINAKIKNIGDLDFYSIDISQAGVLDIDVSNITNGVEMEITLYDSTQNQLATVGGSVSNPTRSMSQLVCGAGTYFIKLNDRSNNEASNDLYNLIVSLDVEDVYECNNDFTTATSINICETIRGAIYSIGDQDYYTFNGTINQEITVDLSEVASNIRPIIAIYDATQNLVTSQTGSTGNSLTFSFIPSSSGQYYLRIEESGNNASNSQLYNLFLSENGCVPLSIDSYLLENNFSLFPNPTKDKFTVRSTNTEPIRQIIVYDMNGRRLISHFGGGTISTMGIQSGLYYVHIITDNGSIIKKLIIR